MSFGQFVALSIFYCVVALIAVLFFGGCELYAPDLEADAGFVDAAMPDAEILGVCETFCEGEELTPWMVDGECAYNICRPSYLHCLCYEDYPTCVSMGCDGTQNVPLYCPVGGGPCFCASPEGPDGWCTS